MKSKIVEAFRITLITLFLFFLSGNIYAYMKLRNLKINSYKSHDKYTLVKEQRYMRNIDSIETNLYGDLCALAGLYEECEFSNGKRVHQFITDEYGYKTNNSIENSKIIIIGDSFLAATGGDNMTEQFGNVISTLISKKVYEAAHPGNISAYNKRHSFFKRINPDAKFLYLVFEGNDFLNQNSPSIKPKTRPWHHARKFYIPIVNLYRDLPLRKLIYLKMKELNAVSSAGTEKNKVLVKKLDSGRLQAFSKTYIKRTNLDQWISSQDEAYIFKNIDSICGFIYVPTAYGTYISKKTLKERHPTLFKQFSGFQNRGIDVVDLTLSLRKAAAKEHNSTSTSPIWWSDDTHWNSYGIKVGALTSIKSLKCLQN